MNQRLMLIELLNKLLFLFVTFQLNKSRLKDRKVTLTNKDRVVHFAFTRQLLKRINAERTLGAGSNMKICKKL